MAPLASRNPLRHRLSVAENPVIHFPAQAKFRGWLLKNHDKASEIFVGFYRKDTGLGGMTYKEAVEEALCFGWIDGVMRKVDDVSYAQRFTPRKPVSNWSNINVAHVQRLTAEGRMHPAGLAAFNVRRADRTGIYSFERAEAAKLPPAFAKRFKANQKAWEFFNAQPPGYRRLMTHKIVSGKQEATRERWLAKVIAASARGRRIE
jgi:uncharacterized protein YdeI (YjbR/CyaY-like superfamily)